MFLMSAITIYFPDLKSIFCHSFFQTYSLVLEAIREIWLVRRQIKDLKDQIDNESSKKVGANLEKLTEDLQEMKGENKQLVSKLKALR